jgi:uncharacterized protein
VVRTLAAAGADVCAADGRGNSALMGAAFKGHTEVVEFLASQPCALDQQNLVGRTALMFASLVGRAQVVATLMKRGASSSVRDADGRTAADWAESQGIDPVFLGAIPTQ